MGETLGTPPMTGPPLLVFGKPVAEMWRSPAMAISPSVDLGITPPSCPMQSMVLAPPAVAPPVVASSSIPLGVIAQKATEAQQAAEKPALPSVAVQHAEQMLSRIQYLMGQVH